MKIYFKNNYQILQTLSKPAEGIEVDYNQIKCGSPTDTETKDLILVNGKVCVVFSNNLTEDIKKILASVLTENKCKVVNSTSTRFDETYIENFAGNIQELPEYTDGLSAGTFRRDGKVFEIIEVIEKYTHLEYVYDIQDAKETKIKELESAYEKSKIIKFVQAKNDEMTVVDREHFFDMISSLKRGVNELIGESDLVIKKHINHQEKKELVAMVYFQRVVFYDKFIFIHEGLPISIREENYSIFTKYKAKIDQCTSQNEIDAIDFNFLRPGGVLIDVQSEAEAILSNPETPEIVKQKIEERRGEDGFIRLFYSY